MLEIDIEKTSLFIHQNRKYYYNLFLNKKTNVDDNEIATICPLRTLDDPEAEETKHDKETLINDINIPGLYSIISYLFT